MKLEEFVEACLKIAEGRPYNLTEFKAYCEQGYYHARAAGVSRLVPKRTVNNYEAQVKTVGTVNGEWRSKLGVDQKQALAYAKKIKESK